MYTTSVFFLDISLMWDYAQIKGRGEFEEEYNSGEKLSRRVDRRKFDPNGSTKLIIKELEFGSCREADIG